MDEKIQNEIFEELKRKVEELGSFSIKEAAALSKSDISLSDQKRLAKILVKGNPYLTEITNGVVVVKKNNLFDSEEAERTKDSTWKIFLFAFVAAGIIFGIVRAILSIPKQH